MSCAVGPRRALYGLLVGLAATGCAPTTRLIATAAPEPCGRVAATADSSAAPPTAWWMPAAAGDRAALARGCREVGPVAIAAATGSAPPRVERLAIVSWNVDAGRGGVAALLADLRAGRLTDAIAPDAIVLLLQEARRRRGEEPALAALARSARLHLYYVPSLRHRARGDARTGDRGNAILSTLPLGDLAAIELPMERQRRVAVAATVVLNLSGRRLPLRLVNVHLENRAGERRAWIRSRAARKRQAEALAAWLPREGALVLGGDLNTWSGEEDAVAVLAARFDRWTAGADDMRPTFGRWRIDHLFQRLPAGIRMTYRRLDERYGSDHAPLVGVITQQPERESRTSGSDGRGSW